MRGWAVIDDVADGFLGVCWGVALVEGVFVLAGEAFTLGDFPFKGDRDNESDALLCEERRGEPFICFEGVVGAIF